MTGYEILTRDTAILTSKNVGHASNFFFAGIRNVLDTSKVDALGSEIVKNHKKSRDAFKSVGHFSPLFAPHILSVLSSRPLKYGGPVFGSMGPGSGAPIYLSLIHI